MIKPARCQSFRRDQPCGVDHRRDAPFHVLAAAAIEAAVAFDRIERRNHAVDTDGIDVPAQHQRAPLRAAVEDADDVGTSRRHLLQFDVEAKGAHVRGDGVGDLRFAGGARHERRVDRIDRHELAQ